MSPGSKYVQLIDPRINNGTHLGGLNYLAQTLLNAYMQKKDRDDEAAAGQALVQGMQPAVSSGSVPGYKPPTQADYDGAGYTPPQNVEWETGLKAGDAVPGTGGIRGALGAVGGLEGNPYAGRLAQQLAMQDIARQQAAADRAAEREAQFRYASRLRAIPQATPPVPGRDVPYSSEVAQQLADIQGAKARAGRETWTLAPGNPGVLVSDSGNIKQNPAAKPPISPAQKAVDTQFGRDYAETFASGGMADAQKNLSQLDAINARLTAIGDGKSEENLTGPVVGRTPDPILLMVNPAAVDARQQVEEVVQRNLRLVLGAQFTEKEGTQLIARAYNPNLDERENAARLGRLIDAMKSAIKAKQAAAEYFEAHGTLAGFKGTASFSLSDMESAMNGRRTSDRKGEAAPGASGPLTPDEEKELEILRKRFGKR